MAGHDAFGVFVMPGERSDRSPLGPLGKGPRCSQD